MTTRYEGIYSHYSHEDEVYDREMRETLTNEEIVRRLNELTAENERLRAAHNKLLRETDTYRWMVNDSGAGYPFVQDVAIKGNEGKQ